MLSRRTTKRTVISLWVIVRLYFITKIIMQYNFFSQKKRSSYRPPFYVCFNDFFSAEFRPQQGSCALWAQHLTKLLLPKLGVSSTTVFIFLAAAAWAWIISSDFFHCSAYRNACTCCCFLHGASACIPVSLVSVKRRLCL